jgi:hypothetical protein
MLRWKLKSVTETTAQPIGEVCNQLVALHKRGECVTLLAHNLFGIVRVADSDPYSPANIGRAGIYFANGLEIGCPERFTNRIG